MNLTCHICSSYLGELQKGKIKKGAVILCKECFDKYKTFESLANYKDGTSKNIDMPDFFKDIFNGKGTK